MSDIKAELTHHQPPVCGHEATTNIGHHDCGSQHCFDLQSNCWKEFLFEANCCVKLVSLLHAHNQDSSTAV